MIHGSMRHTPSGRKKTYNAWGKSKKKVFTSTTSIPSYSYRGSDVHIPSNDSMTGSTEKVESQKYTGTLVKGIGTMHKSNAIPVVDEQQMKDLASMRR